MQMLEVASREGDEKHAELSQARPSQPPAVKLSIPLSKAEEVIGVMHGAFCSGFAAFEKRLPLYSEADKMTLPVWEGALSWMEVQQRLVLNEGGKQLTEEECMQILREIARKDTERVTSHDFRIMLLLRKDTNVAARVQDVTTKFSASKPKLVMSYRWKGPLSHMLRKLSEVQGLDKDELIWVDVLFNPQSFDALDGDAVVGITRVTYTDDDALNHFLFISDNETMEEIMERGWIVLEVASRMASKLPMVKLLDPHNKASEWYLEHKHLTGSNPQDFFNLMKTWDPADKARIQTEIVRVFGSAEQFNRTAMMTFVAAGGKQLLEIRHAEHNYADLLRESAALSKLLSNEGKFSDHLDVCKLQLHAARQEFGREHPEVARSHYELAVAHWRMSEMESALEHATTSRDMRRRLLGSGDNAEVAQCLDLIGTLRNDASMHTAAMDSYNEALHMLQAVDGPEQLHVAKSLLHIGTVHHNMGEYQQALVKFVEAMAIQVKTVGHEHLDVAVSLANIGGVYQNLGEYQQALEKYEEAMAIQVKNVGHEHLDVAKTLMRIGLVFYILGEYQQALAKYDRAMAIQVKHVGHEHIDVAASLCNIGNVYQIQGEYQQALAKHEECLRIMVKNFGQEHLDVAKGLNNIGEVYRLLGKFEEALAKYEESVRIKVKIFGHNHPYVASSLSNIGSVYQIQGKYDLALAKYEEVLALEIKIHGHHHLDVAKSLDNIALIYQNLSRLPEALAKHEEAHRIFVKNVGHEHLDVAKSLNNLGIVYHKMGKNKEALSKYEESLRIKVKNLGRDHIDVAISLVSLGLAHHSWGDRQQALAMYEQAMAIQLKLVGCEHTDTVKGTKLGNLKEALQQLRTNIQNDKRGLVSTRATTIGCVLAALILALGAWLFVSKGQYFGPSSVEPQHDRVEELTTTALASARAGSVRLILVCQGRCTGHAMALLQRVSARLSTWVSPLWVDCSWPSDSCEQLARGAQPEGGQQRLEGYVAVAPGSELGRGRHRMLPLGSPVNDLVKFATKSFEHRHRVQLLSSPDELEKFMTSGDAVVFRAIRVGDGKEVPTLWKTMSLEYRASIPFGHVDASARVLQKLGVTLSAIPAILCLRRATQPQLEVHVLHEGSGADYFNITEQLDAYARRNKYQIEWLRAQREL